MEFKSLNNIETSFRQIRLFALVFICLCALVTGFAVWNSYSFAEKQRQKIYVLDNGKSLMLALSQDMAQNRPVEAKSHVQRFHELFFTLSPDKDAIESNVRRSLFLADKSAYNYYKDLSEKGYYNRVISGNIIPVELAVFDTDGQKGLSVPSSMEQEAFNEAMANIGSGLGTSISFTQNAGQQVAMDVTRGLMQGASGYLAKKFRTVKVKLKAGYKVMLYAKEQ